ncbi:uncharacterized protein L969DRAFT_502670 [Mixia osmundae IAM 14324]|uniref:uncharacterized protein n=1 Tax=Mixia osmundae (strain CBS 9802 / IAM 14324 / JCM 22182 / KY 12970) TaxID=764103 RepID=UPI0004A54B37|nr:uncharacterized protein L969DRAFT_502670 [Mixia osmundae IAM 14324]KEI38981.1 hypothetical protein L969DRAFT_502670 [Mixia osmundae IAM 14324]
MKMVLRHTTQWLVAPDPRVEELMKKCCDIRYLRTFDARLIARDPLTFSGETISAFCDWKEHLDHAAYCREHFHSFVMWPLECEVEVDTCRVIQGRLESNKKCQWRDKAEEMFLEHPDDCSEGWDSDSDTL